MKVRFSSQKERDPARESGMKVLYAPGKRTAFRLRWYLILLLVASPFLWFVGSLLLELLIIEAPARLHIPAMEIRATQSGYVAQLHVKPGQEVFPGERLVSLRNPSLEALRKELEANLSAQPELEPPGDDRTASLRRRVNRARERVEELQRLVAQGAATRGELAAARDALDARRAELQAISTDPGVPLSVRQARARDQAALARVEQQLDSLTVRASEAGQVRDLAVVEGESVGPGTLLLTIRRQVEPRVELYLDAEEADLAVPGQRLRLRFPDNQWIDATIAGAPEDVTRLPPDLRSPLGGDQMGLLVAVKTSEPVPARWKLDNLPLTARFPNLIQRWMNSSG